ncbi:MAG: hypothetical protein A2138_21190 [Deltaproteobacteria bacterium RBG_16_71_12]|nr:MAG: hypothetical protein A2138_21190 [Deltaproteobacteria bacterium RBG_16_71_12]
MVRRVGFSLTKWYLDAVGDDGEVRVGYAAELQAGALRQRYASLLSASVTRAPRTFTRLRGARLPEPRDDVVEWTVPGLRLAGRWRAAAPPLATIELLDQPGALAWSCAQPRARVELTHARRRLRGTGYLEKVELRVPPWQLPIDELRWGRAHVGPHTLVWLDWRGPRRLTHVFLERRTGWLPSPGAASCPMAASRPRQVALLPGCGAPCPRPRGRRRARSANLIGALDGAAVDGVVADDAVATPRLRVQLERRVTLRDGDLTRTAFARAPAVRALLARGKLALQRGSLALIELGAVVSGEPKEHRRRVAIATCRGRDAGIAGKTKPGEASTQVIPAVKETKWLSRATAAHRVGWAIHEVVRWR